MFKIVTNPMIFTIGGIVVIIGLLVMFSGLFALFSYTFTPKKGLHADDSNAFSLGILRCMLAITIADGIIDDSEIVQTAKIYKHLTGNEISHELISETAHDMKEQGVDIAAELRTLAPTLDRPLKEKLVVASLYILMADDDMDEGELMMLDDIRMGLGMSLGKCEKIKKNFMKNREL